MTRVTLTILPDEREALLKLAQRERRNPRDQAVLLIRHELELLGLLPAEPQPAQAQPPGAPMIMATELLPIRPSCAVCEEKLHEFIVDGSATVRCACGRFELNARLWTTSPFVRVTYVDNNLDFVDRVSATDTVVITGLFEVKRIE